MLITLMKSYSIQRQRQVNLRLTLLLHLTLVVDFLCLTSMKIMMSCFGEVGLLSIKVNVFFLQGIPAI